MIPAFNGPGVIQSQPIYNTGINNTVQDIPLQNMQTPQVYSQPLLAQPTTSRINNYLPQQQFINNPPNTQQIIKNRNQHYYRMSSTSDEDIPEIIDDANPWQKVKSTKRRKISINLKPSENDNVNNRFTVLTEPNAEVTQDIQAENKIPKPPPIYIYGVANYDEMIKKLSEILDIEQYKTRCLADNIIKINCHIPENYRKLARFLKESNIIHHTYQPKEDRAFRIVIKHLHHTTQMEEIQEELTAQGHKVRNIINGRHRTTKEPLNLFFVDLEPSENNKDVYKIRYLQNKVILIEPPRKVNGIIQCVRYQQYGHSRAYCNRPYLCVKCGGPHNTTACKKTRDSPAKCALCNGAHPANYKGCEFYHGLFKPHNANNRLSVQPQLNNTNTQIRGTAMPVYQDHRYQRNISYAEATKANITQTSEDSHILSKFLEEFKSMFNQLIQQNSMVLSMLTTLISKIH